MDVFYKIPQESNEVCTCIGNARRDGKNISTTIATASGYVRDAILQALEGLEETYCEECQCKFKAGFFEEKQRREEAISISKVEVANGI
ncbi:hypothetical protein [Gracilimonas sp.]|uniref:hypothetical protein n=1 Tax=Gracilimonas sp. TaxID=1974203 RepID=UPI002871BAD9|nr:hypothetical protein [Gracilimonas sp.]